MTLVVGLGSSRGVRAAAVWSALRLAVPDLAAVTACGTIDRRRDEPGLLAVIREHDAPLHCYPAAELDAVDVPHPSDTVHGHVGTRSVAEAAGSPSQSRRCIHCRSARPAPPAARACAPARSTCCEPLRCARYSSRSDAHPAVNAWKSALPTRSPCGTRSLMEEASLASDDDSEVDQRRTITTSGGHRGALASCGERAKICATFCTTMAV